MVYAYLNDCDSDGLVRLNSVGTIEDLARQGVVLSEGLRLCISDGDLRAEIVVRRPGSEGIWRGEIVDGPHDCDEGD